MRTQELKMFRDLLLQKRNGLLQTIAKRESQNRDTTTIEARDFADVARDLTEKEMALGISHHHRDVLRNIDDAIVRVDSKTYGVCETCGAHMSIARLETLPYARLCVICQGTIERGPVPIQRHESIRHIAG